MKFAFTHQENIELCSIELIHLWSDVYGIIQRQSQAKVGVEVWIDLIKQALEYAYQQEASSVLFRLIESERSGELSDRLSALGFTHKEDRVEFRQKVERLPNEKGSPIRWSTMKDLNWSKIQLAQMLVEVIKDSPDEHDIPDPMTYLEDWLHDSTLTSGPDCVAIGFLEHKACALVVAQINPKDGWSRLSYMGLTPAYRGKDLGHWVHKHGFEMIKQQNGVLYHGGTAATNQAMIRLFQRHGCDAYVKMQEWVFKRSLAHS